MTFRPIDTAPLIAKRKEDRWLRLKGDNDGPYVCWGYWNLKLKDWCEVGTQGQVLVGVTHWAPFS